MSTSTCNLAVKKPNKTKHQCTQFTVNTMEHHSVQCNMMSHQYNVMPHFRGTPKCARLWNTIAYHPLIVILWQTLVFYAIVYLKHNVHFCRKTNKTHYFKKSVHLECACFSLATCGKWSHSCCGCAVALYSTLMTFSTLMTRPACLRPTDWFGASRL